LILELSENLLVMRRRSGPCFELLRSKVFGPFLEQGDLVFLDDRHRVIPYPAPVQLVGRYQYRPGCVPYI
jgi:hypothetical protein